MPSYINLPGAEFERLYDTRSPPRYRVGDHVVRLHGDASRTYRVLRIIAPGFTQQFPESWYVSVVEILSDRTERRLPAQFAARYIHRSLADSIPRTAQEQARVKTNHRIGVPKNKLP